MPKWNRAVSRRLAALRRLASEYDVILTTGGASRGEEDHLVTALERHRRDDAVLGDHRLTRPTTTTTPAATATTTAATRVTALGTVGLGIVVDDRRRSSRGHRGLLRTRTTLTALTTRRTLATRGLATLRGRLLVATTVTTTVLVTATVLIATLAVTVTIAIAVAATAATATIVATARLHTTLLLLLRLADRATGATRDAHLERLREQAEQTVRALLDHRDRRFLALETQRVQAVHHGLLEGLALVHRTPRHVSSFPRSPLPRAPPTGRAPGAGPSSALP